MKRKSDTFDESPSPGSKRTKKRTIEVEGDGFDKYFGRGLFDSSQLAIYKDSYVNSSP